MQNRQLILDLIKDDKIRSFCEQCLAIVDDRAPASCGKHHCYKGGLIDHLCDTANTAYRIASGYSHLVKVDICVAGALLHDVGKQESYTFEESSNVIRTKKGELFGHISIGFRNAYNIAERMNLNHDPDILNILHCIISHHGRKEWGSPIEPQTKEALIVHKSDYIDAFLTYTDFGGGF